MGFILAFLLALVVGGQEIDSDDSQTVQLCTMSDGAAGGCDTYITVKADEISAY